MPTLPPGSRCEWGGVRGKKGRSLGPPEALLSSFLLSSADDRPSQEDFPPREGYIRYGSLVRLVCTVTGVTLPPMVWEGRAPRFTRTVWPRWAGLGGEGPRHEDMCSVLCQNTRLFVGLERGKGCRQGALCQRPRSYWRSREQAGRAASRHPGTLPPHSLPPFCCRSSAK